MTNNNVTLKDVIYFFKSSLKQYVAAFILSIVLVGGVLLYSNYSQNNIDKKEDKNDLLFSFILENNQGNIMTSSGAVKQVFLTSLQETKKYKSELLEQLIVTYNDIENTMDVQLTESVDREKKEEIANLLIKEMNDGKLNYFENKHFYYINKDLENNLKKEDTISEGISKKKIILLIIVLIMLSMILGTILASWKENKNTMISQKFNLGNDVQQIDINSLNISSNIEKSNIIRAIINGTNLKKILVLQENTLIGENLCTNDSAYLIMDLEKIEEPLSIQPEEIIIVCFKNKTSKIWYKKQLEIAKALTSTIKIIYI
ncbi:hypothetical protein ACFC5Y_09890 [Enterococcus faecium]|uniref:hypothetical protein n=1 Tax=Enterococcus faecium TaxID=1352 RepID=UPI0035CAE48A